MLPYMVSTQIAAIDVDGLLQLPRVACLDLQNNDIGHIPPQLGNVTTLKLVHIATSPQVTCFFLLVNSILIYYVCFSPQASTARGEPISESKGNYSGKRNSISSGLFEG